MGVASRKSIQWLPDEAGEKTDTVILSSKKGHFIDVRPIIEPVEKNKAFPFEMAATGHSEVLAENDILFHQDFSSIAVFDAIHAQKNNLPPPPPSLPDRGLFTKLPDNARRETGAMINPDTGKVQDYVEYWADLNPLEATPTDRKILLEADTNNHFATYVLEIKDSAKYSGKLIRIGNWLESVVYDKEDLESPFTVYRTWFNGEKWEDLITWGKLTLPTGFEGVEGDSYEFGGIVWECIESY